MRDYIKNKSVLDSAVVFALGIALGAYSLIRFYTATVKTGWIMSPYLFPLLLSVFALLLSVSLFAEGSYEVRCRRKDKGEKAVAAPMNLKRVLAVTFFGVAYYLMISWVHFIPATVLFLAALIWYMGERKYWRIALVAVIIPFVLYFLFAVLLHVRLP